MTQLFSFLIVIGIIILIHEFGHFSMAKLFKTIFSGIGLLWDRQFGFLKETLVAPVPRLQIMVGRTLGGATIAMDSGRSRSSGCCSRSFTWP